MSGDNLFTNTASVVRAVGGLGHGRSFKERVNTSIADEPYILLETLISPSTLDLAGPISPTVLLSGNEESQPTQTKKFKSAQPPKRATEIFQWLQEVRNPTTKTITGYNCAICKSARQFGLKVGGSWVGNPFQDLNKLKEHATMHNRTTLHKQAASLVTQTQPMIHVAIERLSRQDSDQEGTCFPLVCAAAYFFFMMGIAHTTNWQSILMTIGMCSPFLSWQRDRPANATFTSTTTITGILEAFGT